jgi:hypothetical protein
MKISELIAYLQGLQEKHGDLNVFLCGGSGLAVPLTQSTHFLDVGENRVYKGAGDGHGTVYGLHIYGE